MKANHLLVALLICSWILSACQPAPVPPTATATIAPPTNTPAPTNTSTPTVTPSPTPDIAATQQYESFFSWVQKFSDEGLIPSTEGKYVALDDFSDATSTKQSFRIEFFAGTSHKGSYAYTPYDNKATNFIIQADVKMTAVGDEKDGGCGFAFWKTDNIGTGRAIFFFQDGRAFYAEPSFGAAKQSNYVDAALGADPAGVKLTLLVINDTLNFYVNDRLGMSRESVSALHYTANSTIPVGLLGPAVASGTTEKITTRCVFTNMVLWIMD